MSNPFQTRSAGGKSPFGRSLVLVFLMSAASGYAAYCLQSQANKNVKACSYLDPISIDIVALGAGLFLVSEGFIDMVKHKNSPVRSQLARCLRVCFGVSIVVIHVMQFIRK